MQEISLNKKLLKWTFAIYLFLLSWAIVFKCFSFYLFDNISGGLEKTFFERFFTVNLIPFYTMFGFIKYKSVFHGILFFVNFLITIPFGVFISFFIKSNKKFLYIFLTFFFIELVQTIFVIGGIDSTDIIMNCLGCFVGVWLYNKYVKQTSDNTINKICKHVVIWGGLICILAIIYSIINIINFL